MTLKRRLTTVLPVGKKRNRIMITCLLLIIILFCGFTWVIEFTSSTTFPIEEALDTGLILDFGSVVNMDDLQTYLTEPSIAEQLANGIQSNLSARVYDSIKLPDMTQESPGKKIIKTIFDRLFT